MAELGAGDAAGDAAAEAAGDAADEAAGDGAAAVLVGLAFGVKSIQSAKAVINTINNNRLISRLRTAGACLLDKNWNTLGFCAKPVPDKASRRNVGQVGGAETDEL